MTLDSFCLPAYACAAPVQQDEVRVLERLSPAASRAYVVNTAEQRKREALPDSIQDVPLLVLGLDQGSIGCCGVAYAIHCQKLIHAKFDKYHRIVRDITLAADHACGGIFTKARVYTGYIWGVNNKPFGGGTSTCLAESTILACSMLRRSAPSRSWTRSRRRCSPSYIAGKR